jgi:hypothetical protein
MQLVRAISAAERLGRYRPSSPVGMPRLLSVTLMELSDESQRRNGPPAIHNTELSTTSKKPGGGSPYHPMHRYTFLVAYESSEAPRI